MRHAPILILCISGISAWSTSSLAQTKRSTNVTMAAETSSTTGESNNPTVQTRSQTTTKTGSAATTKTQASRSARPNQEIIADYGALQGEGKSQDALSFATQDYYMLEAQRQERQQYLGPYVSLPTTPTPELETVRSEGTEAEFCLYCALSQVQIPPINLNGTLGGGSGGQNGGGNGRLSGGIPLSSVTSYSNLSPDQAMKVAIKQMCDYVKKNPKCGPNRYAIVSDVSRNTANIRTAIIDISTCGTDGNATIADMFPTGGGSGGISNVSGSHATPPGFFQLTESGRNTRKNWPTCSNGNSFNYFVMEGQGCRYNAAGESCQNTNARSREILYHTWQRVGSSTWGCTGVPQDRFCSWGDKIKGSCLYNYVGS